MPRHCPALPLLALLAVACGDDSTATTAGTDTTGPSTTGATTSAGPTTDGPTTDPPTTAGPTTDPTATATSVTSVTTDVPETSTTFPGTTDSTDTTTTGTTSPDTTGTTGPLDMCGADGDSVTAELVQMGKPAPCGPLEFTGTRISNEKGPLWQLDGCQCGQNCLIPDPWTLAVTAPASWLPLMPACPRIVVDRAMGFGGCEFVAISVWDLAMPGAPAVYHAGHGFAPTQAGAGELTITPVSLATCECQGCCSPAELWDLQFSFTDANLTLSEAESGVLGKHDAINFESHHIGLCDAPLDAHWAIRLPG